MSGAMDSLLATALLAAFLGLSGAWFTLGCVVICRLCKWAPINLVVHVHRDSLETGHDHHG